MQKPLITHFESCILSELDIESSQLVFAVEYEPKHFAKSGIKALLAKTPLLDDKPVVMDIDVSCGLYDELGRLIDRVWFGNKRALGDLVRHHGDTFFAMNKKYRPDIIAESLSLRPWGHEFDKVHRVAFFVHSYHRNPLNQTTGELSFKDQNDTPIHQIPLAGLDDNVSAMCVWEMVRHHDDWRVSAPMQSLIAKDPSKMATLWQEMPKQH